jgi:carbamoyltransferase
MFHEVNDAIKMRDFWMPFAPTILDTWADKYLADWEALQTKSPESLAYMILASEATPLGRKHLRAAMHQKDGSIRPQIVRREDNPDYYRLIEKFCERTGIGGVLNTSMNLHGYPLVGSLEQAMFTFENSKMKHIAIENYLVQKEG